VTASCRLLDFSAFLMGHALLVQVGFEACFTALPTVHTPATLAATLVLAALRSVFLSATGSE
jgi:hypothetical protein